MLFLKTLKIKRKHAQIVFTQTWLTIFMEKLWIQETININGITIIIGMYPVASWVTSAVQNLQMMCPIIFWFSVRLQIIDTLDTILLDWSTWIYSGFFFEGNFPYIYNLIHIRWHILNKLHISKYYQHSQNKNNTRKQKAVHMSWAATYL